MALKSKALKKSLSQVAEENARVTKGTSKNQEVLKEGKPNDLHLRQNNLGRVVGVSIGSTLNMGDYQSLRADVWLTDTVSENETISQAYERVINTVSGTLDEIISLYKE